MLHLLISGFAKIFNSSAHAHSIDSRAFIDGGFYTYGLTENPATEMVREILEDNAAEKIKSDLKRIKSDYRSAYKRSIETIVIH